MKVLAIGSTPWIKGKSIKPTEEHKLKVSIGLKKSYSNGHRLSWNKGKIMDEETRKKISIANIGKPKGKFPTHCRWHVNRGIFNKNCEYCIGSIKKCRES